MSTFWIFLHENYLGLFRQSTLTWMLTNSFHDCQSYTNLRQGENLKTYILMDRKARLLIFLPMDKKKSFCFVRNQYGNVLNCLQINLELVLTSFLLLLLFGCFVFSIDSGLFTGVYITYQ